MIRAFVVSVLIGGAAQAAQMPPGEVPLDAPVVFMGERHDVAEHHRNQAAWVARLAPRAVVFEMLPPGLADVAMRLRGADEATLGEALSWQARGWGPFADYAPIFAALGDARIVGAEVARDDLMAAVGQGAAATFGDGAARYGLDRPLSPDEQSAREAEQDVAHCGLMPAEMLPGMVEAQRLRDAALARAALEAYEATGGPVAVITGNGHARADAAPAYIATADPALRVLSLGQFTEARDDPSFDAWVVTDPDPRSPEDPCDALR